MQTSTNLGLNLIEGTDNVDISKVTDNFATLDTEVAKVATTSAAGRMSAADKSKLDGVAAGANNYVHPSGDGNLHVPATGTTNNGKVLKAGATAGSAAWNSVAFSELTGTVGAATDTVIGNRTIDDTVAAATGADTPTRLWSKLGNMIKAITGKANWYTAPATTLEAASTHIADNVRHITAAERTTWNAKETPSGAQSKADAAAATVQGGLDAHLADYAANAVKTDGSNPIVGDLRYSGTTRMIKSVNDASRVILCGGANASVANGAFVTIEGKDFSGAGAGGNVYLAVGSSGKAYVKVPGNIDKEIWHAGNLVYEGGTFTPIIKGVTTAGAHTYTYQNGSYYRVGKLIFIDALIVLNVKDTAMAGSIVVSGLPFVCKNTSVLSVGHIENVVTGDKYMSTRFTATGSSELWIYKTNSGSTATAVSSADIANGARIYISGSYTIN